MFYPLFLANFNDCCRRVPRHRRKYLLVELPMIYPPKIYYNISRNLARLLTYSYRNHLEHSHSLHFWMFKLPKVYSVKTTSLRACLCISTALLLKIIHAPAPRMVSVMTIITRHRIKTFEKKSRGTITTLIIKIFNRILRKILPLDY